MRSCAQQGIGEGAGAETWLDDTNFNSRHDIFAAACVTPRRATFHKSVSRGYALHPSVCEPSAATERSNSRNKAAKLQRWLCQRPAARAALSRAVPAHERRRPAARAGGSRRG